MYTVNEDIKKVKEAFNNLLPWEKLQCFQEIEAENPNINTCDEPEEPYYFGMSDIEQFLLDHDENEILEKMDIDNVADYVTNDSYALRRVMELAGVHSVAREITADCMLPEIVEEALKMSSDKDKKEDIKTLLEVIGEAINE